MQNYDVGWTALVPELRLNIPELRKMLVGVPHCKITAQHPDIPIPGYILTAVFVGVAYDAVGLAADVARLC